VNTFYIIGIGVGLAMDTFAVAIATSIALKKVTGRQLFRLSWHFGLFQGIMPVIGWGAGSTIERYINPWDHWLAFVLLCYVGGKAIYEAYREETNEFQEKLAKMDPTRGWSLIVLSLATSIDALAVGMSFAMLKVTIWYASLVIGTVTALLTLVGMMLGARLGGRFGERMEIVGGLVLIGIGLKIIWEHIVPAAI
jgi:manganese efflux pump family protein